jgi:hypothetical protein
MESTTSLKRRRDLVRAFETIAKSLDDRIGTTLLADVLAQPCESANTLDITMNSDSAAAYLGVTVKTLAMWRWRGTVGPPYSKSGSRVVYRRSDLQAYLRTARRHSTSQR